MSIWDKIAGKQSAALEARIKALEAENATLTETLSAAKTENDGLKATIAEKDKTIAAKDTEISGLNNKVQETAASVDKTASVKALEITTAQGQPPLETIQNANTASDPLVRISQAKTAKEAAQIYAKEIAPKLKPIGNQARAAKA